MSGITIKLSGIGDIRQKLKGYSDGVVDAVKKEIFSTANEIRNEAQNLCPVDTARLKNSIGVNYAADGLGATVSTDVDYSLYVEYGTGDKSSMPQFSKNPEWKGMKPQPFMNPAAEANRKPFEDKIKEILNEGH